MYRFLIVLNTILRELRHLQNLIRLKRFRRSLVKRIESVAVEIGLFAYCSIFFFNVFAVQIRYKQYDCNHIGNK
ncbi:hypothetical protein UFOVP198_35 [uncultured Caudovirales phage]|uniref:Uncharacterized protein n=1 Tax=uncultured Caudovirales phage TaxID=2100421 RepID=A0A6J7WI62_9CAUD|nr:hypothetical protein UFOVP198_35 [uncultured Caudovirales phage]